MLPWCSFESLANFHKMSMYLNQLTTFDNDDGHKISFLIRLPEVRGKPPESDAVL